jgi:hypothetical protein
MALTYKNAKKIVSGSYADVYTCPAGKSAIVTLAQAANVDASAYTLNAQWLDDSDSDTATRICHTLNIPAGSAVNILGGKLILEAGDRVQAMASSASKIELTLSIIEL